jgi:hypothetical protein
MTMRFRLAKMQAMVVSFLVALSLGFTSRLVEQRRAISVVSRRAFPVIG